MIWYRIICLFLVRTRIYVHYNVVENKCSLKFHWTKKINLKYEQRESFSSSDTLTNKTTPHHDHIIHLQHCFTHTINRDYYTLRTQPLFLLLSRLNAFFGIRITRVHHPVALHVHQAHLGTGQQSADHLKPAARSVQQPVSAGQLLLDLPFSARVSGQSGLDVLYVVR